MKLDRQNQFDKTLQVRVPKTFVDELDEAATRRMVNRADHIRMALPDRLKTDSGGPAQMAGAA